MVGIPGKSKGCITCKRRKVRCSLEKPACERCVKSNRKCEGYSSYSVFINRDQSGLRRRRRLEEARFSSPALIASTGLSLQPSQDEQIIALFWDNYAATGTTVRERPLWLHHAIVMSTTTDILRQVLLAIAYTQAGRYRDDPPSVLHGQKYYGTSLVLMQRALYDPILARTDEVLAAARCMVLYEAFESTTDTMLSWISQVKGMERIMQLRSPHDFTEPFARAVLESTRQNAMIASMIARTGSFLGDEEWRIIPWTGVSKGEDQKLYDQGFIVADLYKNIDGDHNLSAQQYRDNFTQIAQSYEALSLLNDEIIQRRGDKDSESSIDMSPVLSISLAGMDLTLSVLAETLLYKCPPSIINENGELIQHFVGSTSHQRRKELARQILQHVVRCVEKEPRFIVHQLLFALNAARFELRGSREDHVQMQAVLDTIESRNRHRLVGSLRRTAQSILPAAVQARQKLSASQAT